ncbi:FAD-dependent oxidoreductase [Candidatus Babeliales bacterium]|nr:FAD-dependent oxidoreductase [Candidatus Babeliales bacterium]
MIRLEKKITLACVFILCFTGCLNIKKNDITSPGLNINKKTFDADAYSSIIIGGGIGGLTSAIYLAQAGYNPILIEGPLPGGNLTGSYSVKNWPGEINITGKKLAEKIKTQIIENGVKVLQQEVIKVDFTTWPYEIQSKDSANKITKLKTLSCIIAIGAKPNYLKIPGEKEYWGQGVSNCSTCDGHFFKNKNVAIIGGGESAILEASYLSNIAKEVLIFVRKNHLKTNSKLKDEVLSKNNVKIFYNTKVKKIEGNGEQIIKILVYDYKTKTEKYMKIDGIFLAIGLTPNSLFLKGQLNLDPNGYIKLTNNQETSQRGIFAIGDVVNPKFKQAIISAGEGAVAAIQTTEFLEEVGFNSQKYQVKKEDNRLEMKVANKNTKHKELIILKNKKHLDEILKNTKQPIVIDFYSEYCEPCKYMAPIFEKLAKDLYEKATFIKIDVMNHSNLAHQYRIQGIPSFILLDSNGIEVKRIIGITEYTNLEQAIYEINEKQ